MRFPIFRPFFAPALCVLACISPAVTASAGPPEAPFVEPFPAPGSLGGDGALSTADADPVYATDSVSIPQDTPTIEGAERSDWTEYDLTWTTPIPQSPTADYELLKYLIQRRDGPKKWQTVGERTYNPLWSSYAYTDHVDALNRHYHYRIIPQYKISGKTYAGHPSNVVSYFRAWSLELKTRTSNIGHEPIENGIQGYTVLFTPDQLGTTDPCSGTRLFRTQTVTETYTYKMKKKGEYYWANVTDDPYRQDMDCSGSRKEISHYTGSGGNIAYSGEEKINAKQLTDGANRGGPTWNHVIYSVSRKQRPDGSWSWEDWTGDYLYDNNADQPPKTVITYSNNIGWKLDIECGTYRTGERDEDVFSDGPVVEEEKSPTRSRHKETRKANVLNYDMFYEWEKVTTRSDEIPWSEKYRTVTSPWSEWGFGQTCASTALFDACGDLLNSTTVQYKYSSSVPTAKTTVRWAEQYNSDGPSEPENKYFGWTATPSDQESDPTTLAIDEPGTACIVPYTARLTASDWRGIADEDEKAVRFNKYYGQSAGRPDMAGVTILLDGEPNTTREAATLHLEVGGGVVDSDWESTLSWNTSDLTIWAPSPGHPEISTRLESPLVCKGACNYEFHIEANPQKRIIRDLDSTVNLTVRDKEGKTTATDLVRLHLLRWPMPSVGSVTWDERVNFSDAVGSRYRKIGLNGRPISDSKPQAEPESDEPKEETYIDAFSLGLVHSTSDIYIPVPGSLLTLSARRNVQSEIWNLKSGLRPHERLDRPFGAGWSTNLVSYIEFTEPQGSAADGGKNPIEAVVHDEDGGEHRFVKAGALWVPFVTAKNNARAYLTSLMADNNGTSDQANDDTWVFKRKYGNTLRFRKGSASHGEITYATLSSDRLEGRGDGSVKYSYSRLDWVEDRLGYRLVYSYPGSSLIPNEIHAEKADSSHTPFPGLQIYIRQADQKRITQIWDPSGNTTTYSYEMRSAPSHPVTGAAQSVPLLKSVVHYDHSSPDPVQVGGANYDYNAGLSAADDEPATLPERPEIMFAPNLHLDITQIGDDLGNNWRFGYDFDHTKEIYVTSDLKVGYYKQNGLPRWVTKITAPAGSNVGAVTFENLTDLRLTKGATLDLDTLTGTESASSPAVRKSRVIDALGNPTTYTFTGNQIVTLVAFRQLASLSSPDDRFFDPRLVYFTGMQIEHGNLGTEAFTFKPEAGLALSSLKDFSGNETKFFYQNPISVPAWLTQIYPPGTTLFTYWDDVTRQVRMLDNLDKTRSYTYSASHRIMESMTDEEGRLTLYTIDTKGRRIAEKIYAQASDANDGTPPVSETLTEYGTSPTFSDPLPGFVTRQTIKRRSADPGWAGDIVTDFEPDYLRDEEGHPDLDANGHLQYQGRVASQTRYPHQNADDDPDTIPVTASVQPLVTTYTYDFNNNRTSVTDPKGKVTVFSYDGFNRLKNTTYHNWDFESRDYDLRGKLTKQTIWTSPAVGESDPTIVRQSEFRYDSAGRCVESEALVSESPTTVTALTKNGYNAVGSLVSIVDPLHQITRHAYDALQRLTSTIDAAGGTTTYEYNPARNTGASGFDSSGFKPTRVKDARGFATEFDYDEFYRLKATRAEWKKGAFASTVSEYDDVGNLRTVTDPLGKKSVTTYDALNRPTSVVTAYGTNEAITTTTAYTGTGLAWKSTVAGTGSLWSTTDPVVRVTETHYDLAARPIRTVQPTVTEGKAVEKTFYDEAGNVARVADPRSSSAHVIDHLYGYDDRHRRIQEQLPAVLDALTGSTTLVCPTIVTGYRADGLKTSVTDAKGKTTDFTYDKLGRLTLTVFPFATPPTSSEETRPQTSTKYDLNGNTLEVLDPENKKTVNTYDAVGRLLTTTNPQGITVSYGYDKAGNRISVTDGLKQTTRFDYDGLGRLTAEIDPSDLKKRYPKSFVYDAVNKIRQIDSLGQITDYQYDHLHRLRHAFYVGTSAQDRDYDYDIEGNLLSVAHPNQDGATDTHYTYDARNQRRTEISAGVTHTYGYDLAGNRTSVSTDGWPVYYQFDDAGRLSKVLQGGGSNPPTTEYQYDLNGNAHRLILPSGERTVTTHDALNRVLTRKGFIPANAAAETTPAYTFTYVNDKAGNVKTITEDYTDDRLPDRVVTNLYDNAYRLEKETIATAALGSTSARTVVTDYVYDDANNRTQRTVTTNSDPSVATHYSYNVLNQLTGTSVGGGSNLTQTVYRYDANGNRASRSVRPPAPAAAEVTGYVYDRDNRLIEVVENTSPRLVTIQPANRPGPTVQASYFLGGKSHQYRYDHRTRRVGRTEPDPTSGTPVSTRITFAGGVSVAEYPAGSTTPDVRYVRGMDIGGGVGGMLYSLRSGTASYSHYNARGDVTARTDDTGAATYSAAYEAFGTTPEKTGTNPDRFAANSKEEDPTGLLNEGFRYRDLDTGTFLTRDPLGFVDGPNMYTYVVQNPWTKFDPTGLFFDDVSGFWGLEEWKTFASAFNEQQRNLSSSTVDGMGAAVTETAKTAVDASVYACGDAYWQPLSNTFQETDRPTIAGGLLDANIVLATARMTASVGTLGLSDAAIGTYQSFETGDPIHAQLGFAGALTGLVGAKGAGIEGPSFFDAENAGGLFRRSANVGQFADLPVTMNLKTVRQYADAAGVGLDGIKVKIVRQADLKGRGMFGYAHQNGKQIDLYPDAFSSPEELIRTLGHERTHIYQFKTFGKVSGSDVSGPFEEAAVGIENTYFQFWKANGGR